MPPKKSWTWWRSYEAERESSVVLVQLLAAVGMEGSDIALCLLRVSGLDETWGVRFSRSSMSSGDALLWMMGLRRIRKAGGTLLPNDSVGLWVMAADAAKRGRVKKWTLTWRLWRQHRRRRRWRADGRAGGGPAAQCDRTLEWHDGATRWTRVQSAGKLLASHSSHARHPPSGLGQGCFRSSVPERQGWF